jgi:hypothetical protein
MKGLPMPNIEDKEMFLRIYRQGKEVLIAVCDCDILSKQFKEGGLQLEISSDFYGRELATPAEVEKALAEATVANFAGCRAVEHAIRLGYVERENVLCIQGIFCAQMVRM